MIKVTKYTQGHLQPTASFTWVERRRHGGVEARSGEKKKEKEGKAGSEDGERAEVRGKLGRKGSGGDKGGKREEVRSLMTPEMDGTLWVLQDPCWDRGALLIVIARRSTWLLH